MMNYGEINFKAVVFRTSWDRSQDVGVFRTLFYKFVNLLTESYIRTIQLLYSRKHRTVTCEGPGSIQGHSTWNGQNGPGLGSSPSTCDMALSVSFHQCSMLTGSSITDVTYN